MPLVLVRVDDRLLHGQVTYGWVPSTHPDLIVVADDAAAADAWQREAFEASGPDGVEILVLSLRETIEARPRLEHERTMLLVRGPRELLSLVHAGLVPPRVNVGGLHAGPGRVRFRDDLQLTREEAMLFEEIAQAGVLCEFRALPRDNPAVLPDVITLEEASLGREDGSAPRQDGSVRQEGS